MTEYTVSRLEYTPLLQAIDGVLRGLGSLGLPLTSLDPDSMMRAAQRQTGLHDWGDIDFQEPLRHLMGLVDGYPLTGIGRASGRGACVKALTNRLYIEDYVRRFPEVEDIEIKRPVFILGFPRTGTTLLQNLMSLTPELRPLRFWEVAQPVPAHRDRDKDRAQRRRQAAMLVKAAYFIAPEQKFIHQIGVDTLEECWPLFFNAFQALNYDLTAGVRPFGDWMRDRDMVPAYRYYKRQLQILAHQQPTQHFLLKCPEHLWFVGALLEVFPDACIVWTHRDPVASTASYCSLSSLQRRLLYGVIDAPRIGQHVQDRFRIGVQRAMAARTAHGDEAAFFDVDFSTLAKDPVAMVDRIRGHFDLERPPDAEARMRDWLANKRADKRGRHIYSAEQWGLDRASVLADFAPYIERFAIPVKRP